MAPTVVSTGFMRSNDAASTAFANGRHAVAGSDSNHETNGTARTVGFAAGVAGRDAESPQVLPQPVLLPVAQPTARSARAPATAFATDGVSSGASEVLRNVKGSASAGKAEGRRGWTAQSSGNGSGLGCWIRTAINGATTEGSSPSSSSYHGGIRASADVAPAVDSVNGGGGGGGDGSSDRAESSFARGTPAAANSQSENGAAGRLEEGRIAVMELASQVQTAFAELQRLREEETSSASASISLTGAPERTFSRFATTAMKSFASAAALLVNLGPRPRPRPPPPPPPSRWRVAGVEGHELLVALAPLLQEMVKKQKREIASAVRHFISTTTSVFDVLFVCVFGLSDFQRSSIASYIPSTSTRLRLITPPKCGHVSISFVAPLFGISVVFHIILICRSLHLFCSYRVRHR